MAAIIRQPGFISAVKGGQQLRDFYGEGMLSYFYVRYISELQSLLFVDHMEQLLTGVDASGVLAGSETPFLLGFASLAVLGAQRILKASIGCLRHLETLEYLFARGLDANVADIVGSTALFHATTSPDPRDDLSRCLVKNGADVNHRDRFGETCLLGSMQSNVIASVELLLESDADVDIAGADGLSPRMYYLSCGPEVVAVMAKWLRKRAGTEAPRTEKRCDSCGSSPPSLLNCGRCAVARYCSRECQGEAWRTHKRSCRPFSALNSVILKPFYDAKGTLWSVAEVSRMLMGYPAQACYWTKRQTRSGHVPKNCSGKVLVVKVQVPIGEDPQYPATGELLVYNKKRDFVCSIRRVDGPVDYDRVALAVRRDGTGSVDGEGGVKAYFVAELRGKDILVVKTSEPLAEQPW
ncbi:hypothetical protein C8R47DRAFT_970205 [Mycena vitilis]|nr:hypothetical protein C8R47DRAFT_970205 [Mycena vitilis]